MYLMYPRIYGTEPISFLTTSGWFSHEEYMNDEDCSNFDEIATFVGNNVSFGKPLKCSIDDIKKSPILSLGDLCLITEDQLMYYTNNQDDWDFNFATAKELIDKDIYIGKCIYVPDNLDITQETQDDIVLAKLNAIIYNFAQGMGDDYIILNEKSPSYIQDIAELCGYLNIKIEEYKNDFLILSNLDPVILNLSPLINLENNEVVQLITHFPTWLYNSHPYAQREFLKIFLKINSNDLKTTFKVGKGINNLQHLGVRCGLPISYLKDEKLLISTSPMKKVKITKVKDKDDYLASSIKIEPTNIMLYSNNEECFINCG